MIICSANAISKMYGGNMVFENIVFEINEGEKVGFVGRNGSGKSTLFHILSGKESPDCGEIHWKKGSSIGYLEQSLSAESDLVVRDSLLQAFSTLLNKEVKMKKIEKDMSQEKNQERLSKLLDEYGDLLEDFTINGGYEMSSQMEAVANGLKIYPLLEQKISALSGGEKTKIALAYVLLKKPNILLLDEPTNHLDLIAIEWLGQFLKNYQGTVMIISHDRYFLDEVIERIFDLDNGEIRSYLTNYSDYTKAKEKQLLLEFQAYEEQKKKIKKMREAIKRIREWARIGDNEKMHKRARNMERALERIETLSRLTLNSKKMKLELATTDRTGKDVVIAKDVAMEFDTQMLFSDVNFVINYRDRAAIVGENGSGKSTLIKLMLQQMPPSQGGVKLGSNVKVGYLSQHAFEDIGKTTVIEAFRDNYNCTEGEARNILSRFLFFGYTVFQKVSKLSGGEKMRLRLAQLMHQEINFLVLDEPTNHLDIESREVLEETLEKFEGVIVAISHDRYFLNKLFTKIYWIEHKQVHTFAGSYEWAKKKLLEKKEFTLPSPNRKSRENSLKAAPRLDYNQDRIQLEMAAIEKRLNEINNEMEKNKDLQQLQQLFEEKESLEKQWEMFCNSLEE